MSAITNLSDLVNRMSGGNSGTPEVIYNFKTNLVAGGTTAASAPIAGRWMSLWQFNGSRGYGGVPGSTWLVPTNATAGGLLHDDPGGGRQKWLVSVMANTMQAGTFMLYDRLGTVSGMNATTTTAQTVTSGNTTRYADGVGVQLFIEIYTQIGTTATTATVDYKDAGGSTRTSSSFAIGGTGLREAQRLIPVPLNPSYPTCTGVVNCDLVASTTTAGDFGVTAYKPLALISVPSAGAAGIRDFSVGLPGMPEVQTDACLALAFFPVTTTALAHSLFAASMVEA